MAVLSIKALLVVLPFYLQQVSAEVSGTGSTTRYWDCCKPSCSWPGKATLAAGSSPVNSCDKNDVLLSDSNTASACNSGTSFMCSNELPWAVSSTLSYGYAAVSIAGGSEASWCCACYELTFTSGPVAGKKMVVQATNSGNDLVTNHFDIAIPGGGFGDFDACSQQYSTLSMDWGAQYGGVSSRSQCDTYPDALRAGCYWRFDWFQGADNPTVSFRQVICPAALTNKTGCVRADDVISESPTGPVSTSTYTGSGPGSSAGVGRSRETSRSSASAPPASSTANSQPAGKSSVASGTSSSATPCGSEAAAVKQYGQCGGINHTGSTKCAEGTTCKFYNPYYSQCV